MSKQIWGPRYDTVIATGSVRKGQAVKLEAQDNTVRAVNSSSDLVFAFSDQDAPNGGTLDIVKEGGDAMVLAGGNVAIGDRVRIDAQGRVVRASTNGEESIGIALGAGSEDNIVRILFTRTTIGTTFAPPSVTTLFANNDPRIYSDTPAGIRAHLQALTSSSRTMTILSEGAGLLNNRWPPNAGVRFPAAETYNAEVPAFRFQVGTDMTVGGFRIRQRSSGLIVELDIRAIAGVTKPVFDTSDTVSFSWGSNTLVATYDSEPSTTATDFFDGKGSVPSWSYEFTDPAGPGTDMPEDVDIAISFTGSSGIGIALIPDNSRADIANATDGTVVFQRDLNNFILSRWEKFLGSWLMTAHFRQRS